ncbi:MAG: hypothetical protein ACLTDS_14820 [Bianqueaceae bacterium]
MRVDELSTPALVLMDVFGERRRMQRLMEETGTHLRPHFKSHKCSRIAKLQMEAGARELPVVAKRVLWRVSRTS